MIGGLMGGGGPMGILNKVMQQVQQMQQQQTDESSQCSQRGQNDPAQMFQQIMQPHRLRRGQREGYLRLSANPDPPTFCLRIVGDMPGFQDTVYPVRWDERSRNRVIEPLPHIHPESATF